MMRILFMASLSLACLPLAAVAQTAAQPAQDSALVAEVRRLIAARVESSIDADSATLHRLIAPGYVHVEDSGARMTTSALLQYIGGSRSSAAALPAHQVTVTQVEVRRVGSVLLADALVTLEWRAAAGSFTSRSREMNALVRVNSRWRFAQHSDTPVMALGAYPVAAAPDSTTLGEFVGDHEGWLGAVDRVTQRGSRLYLEDRDHKELGAVKLVAAGAEAFYPENESVALMVFARDTAGRVTNYITRMAGGPLLIARRIR